MSDEKKRSLARYAVGSVPVGILGLIYQSMNNLTMSVETLNESLAVIAAQVGRNTSDIQYQRDKHDKTGENMQRIIESLSEIKGSLKKAERPF